MNRNLKLVINNGNKKSEGVYEVDDGRMGEWRFWYSNGELACSALFKGWERMINPLAMKAYDEYYKLAKENELTMVQLAQAFVNSRPFVTSNIIGATTMAQLKENIESINIELSEEIMEKINLIHNNNPNPSP